MTTSLAVHSHADSPSVVRHWLDKARRAAGLGTGHMTHVAHHGLHSVQQYGEAGIVGLVCAYAEVHNIAQGKYNFELGLAAAGLMLPLLPVDSLKGVSADARNVGSAAFAIYAKEQAKKLLIAKRSSVAGDFGADPVQQTAARLKGTL